MTWRQWLGAVLAATAVGTAAPAADTVEAAKPEADVAEARMKQDVTYLASDECEGRGVTTAGIDRAADYVARQFQKAGLKPGGPGGTYFQPFTIRGSKLDAPPKVTLRGPLGQQVELKAGTHYQPMGLSASGAAPAGVVFVGYGITITGKDAYDYYAGQDVEGKVVVVLRDAPRPDN